MEVFAGPQQTPPRVSLLSAADIVPTQDAHWQNGFFAELDGYGEVNTFDVCPDEDATFDIAATDAVGSFKPYVLYATHRKNTFQDKDNDETGSFYDKAQRKLLAGEAAALESILWDGYPGFPTANPYLTDGAGGYAPIDLALPSADCVEATSTDTISNSVTAVDEAFAVLEQTFSQDSGTRGMIHLRPQALHALVKAQVVRREGNVWLSPLDNIVVPGRGYAGTGPGGEAVGATEWMYGHAGIVQVRLGPIVRLGEGDFASQFIRGWNDRQVIVYRVAHVLLDPTTQVYAIDFDSLTA